MDFYHACDHLKEGCDAAWGESTPRSKAEFERLKTLLKEADNGVERIIRVLKYHRDRASGHKRERVGTQLTYFRNQKHRMHYAEYIRRGPADCQRGDGSLLQNAGNPTNEAIGHLRAEDKQS